MKIKHSLAVAALAALTLCPLVPAQQSTSTSTSPQSNSSSTTGTPSQASPDAQSQNFGGNPNTNPKKDKKAAKGDKSHKMNNGMGNDTASPSGAASSTTPQ